MPGALSGIESEPTIWNRVSEVKGVGQECPTHWNSCDRQRSVGEQQMRFGSAQKKVPSAAEAALNLGALYGAA
jgi:hypothetical protein